MANAGLGPQPIYRSILASGAVNAGGKIYTYEAGTSTPKGTQVSRTGAANANPVVLDASGEAPIWFLTGQYKIIEKTSADVTLRTIDEFSAAGDLPQLWTATGADTYYSAGNVYIGASSGGETLTVVGTASVSGTLAVTGVATFASQIAASNGMKLADDKRIILGTGSDAAIYYDGTDLILDPDVVGSGSVKINGILSSPTQADFTGATTISTVTITGDLIVTTAGNIVVNATKFTVDGTTGDTIIEGTLGVTGLATFTAGILSNDDITLGAGDNLIGSTTSIIDLGSNNFNANGATGNVIVGGTLNVSGKTTIATPTTSIASINLPHGTAPTSPVNGDMWTTTAGLFVRINGSTIGPLS